MRTDIIAPPARTDIRVPRLEKVTVGCGLFGMGQGTRARVPFLCHRAGLASVRLTTGMFDVGSHGALSLSPQITGWTGSCAVVRDAFLIE